MNTAIASTWNELLHSALAHHRAGRLDQAETGYRQVLAQRPGQPDALRLLGVLAHQRGQLESARGFLELALQAQPNAAEIHHALAVVWFDLGQYRKAVAACQSAIRLRPDYPEAQYHLGSACYALGEGEAAAKAYRQAVALQPALAEAHYSLGVIAREKADPAGAVEHLERALRCRPNYPEALLNLGLAEQHLGNLAQAAKCFLKALEWKSDSLPAWLNLGTVRRLEKNLTEAEVCFRRALALQPEDISAHLNLALVLDERGALADAERALQSAMLLDPANSQVHSYLAGLLKKQHRLEEAATHYRRTLELAPDDLPARVALVEVLISLDKLEEASALCEEILRVDPENAETLVFLGMVRFRQHRPAEAWKPYEKALRINSANPDARLNLALCQLLLGDYRSGFRNYEARWQSKLSTAIVRPFAEPRWQGEDVRGKTVLLYAEQGLGDAIHFVRYAPLVAERGARVVVECPAPLQGLFERVAGIATVVVHGEQLPPFDFQIPFLSLPIVFETTLESIPCQVPYLRVPDLVNFPLPPCEPGQLKVGLVWAGNPRHANDKTRSIPPSLFSRLWSLPGLAFYSLQVGPAARQLAQVDSAKCVRDLAPQLTDFIGTAAAVQKLDLILSVDTAVAHLAGALARPVWLLLPFVTDWRWLIERDDSPWYPTMRLFRQEEPGDWPGVFESLRHQLAELTNHPSSSASRPPHTAGPDANQ